MANSPFGIASPFSDGPFYRRDGSYGQYSANGLAPALVGDFTRNLFLTDICKQHVVRELTPALSANFTTNNIVSVYP